MTCPPESPIPIDSALLISDTFGDTTKGYIGWDPGSSEEIGYTTFNKSHTSILITAKPFDTEDQLFIDQMIQSLDPVIDLDFLEVDSITGAEVVFFSVDRYLPWLGSSTVGQVVNLPNRWLVLVKDTGDAEFDQSTIVHEFGHALGLSHPGERPNNPLYNSVQHTVMSYNPYDGRWGTNFTPSDYDALTQIWGPENDAAKQIGL